MRYKAEVQVAGENGWHGNELTFDTRQKAEDYAKDLHGRWFQSAGWRVVEITKQKGEINE